MKVSLKNAQNQLIATVDVESLTTVRALREWIALNLGVAERLQRLLYRGHEIKDVCATNCRKEYTLRDYLVVEKNPIVVLQRPDEQKDDRSLCCFSDGDATKDL